MSSFWNFLQRELVTGESDEKEAQQHFDKRQGVYNFLYVPWCLEKVSSRLPNCVDPFSRAYSAGAHVALRAAFHPWMRRHARLLPLPLQRDACPHRCALGALRILHHHVQVRGTRQGRASTLLTLPCAQVGALCAALPRVALARHRAPFYLALRGLRSEVRQIHVC